jgi:uncharacterized protein
MSATPSCCCFQANLNLKFNNMRQITRRFTKGQDLRKEIEKLAQEETIKAGVVLCAVGSLEPLRLRMAGAKIVREWPGEFEITSMMGTLSYHGQHIHMTASDVDGVVYGGHLKEGCIVRTTVEFVILAFDDIEYRRAKDLQTGFEELAL